MRFDLEAFLTGKECEVTGYSEWTDYNTKSHLGTKVEVIITKDETDYQLKDKSSKSNVYERFIIKVKKDVQIPTGAKLVSLKNHVATAYGKNRDGSFSNYLNFISITCDDIVTK